VDGPTFLKGFLWACGKIEKNATGDLDFEIEDLIGSHIQARVTVDTEYDSNRVRNIRPYEGAQSGDALAPA
jgi:hypothetical protein